MTGAKRVLGVIGGSGVYNIAAFESVERVAMDTPWGRPSDKLVCGKLRGVDVVFLARHGQGHVIPPDGINYRANIDALKRAGVTDVLSLSACGSFREELSPGTFVIVDQFIDRTSAREKTFSDRALLHMSRWRSRYALRLGMRLRRLVSRSTLIAIEVEPIWQLTGRNSPRRRSPTSTGHGMRCHWHDEYA